MIRNFDTVVLTFPRHDCLEQPAVEQNDRNEEDQVFHERRELPAQFGFPSDQRGQMGGDGLHADMLIRVGSVRCLTPAYGFSKGREKGVLVALEDGLSPPPASEFEEGLQRSVHQIRREVTHRSA